MAWFVIAKIDRYNYLSLKIHLWTKKRQAKSEIQQGIYIKFISLFKNVVLSRNYKDVLYIKETEWNNWSCVNRKKLISIWNMNYFLQLLVLKKPHVQLLYKKNYVTLTKWEKMFFTNSVILLCDHQLMKKNIFWKIRYFNFYSLIKSSWVMFDVQTKKNMEKEFFLCLFFKKMK